MLSILKLFKIKQNKGFSLIELSIIISAAASATVGYLAWTQPPNITDAKKVIETKKEMHEIAQAMEAYVVENGRMPCPADPFMRIDNTRHASGGTDYYVNDFGEEDLDTTDSTVNSITTHGVDCPSSTGAIPIAALSLSNDYIEDGWGRRYTYKISDKLCYADAGTEAGVSAAASRLYGCTKKDYTNGTGNITVTDGSNNLTTKAAFVIVSHGANGKGAYIPNGSKLANGIGDELENSDADNTFVKAAKTSSFDDITYFKTKIQVERLASHSDTKQLSVTDCETNSQSIKTIDLAETNAMTSTITGYTSNGQQVGTSILRATQSICVNYYGATAATIDGQTWSGAQCPGNTTGNSTYYAPTDTCTCLGGAWDGNCTTDWDALLTVRSGLQFWLDANYTSAFTDTACTSAAADGNNIACWKDKSDNQEDVTQGTAGNQPSYHTNVQSSKPVIRFDNNDKLLGSDLSLFDYSTNDFSWSIVAKTDLGSASKNPVFGTLKNSSNWTGFIAGYNASEQPYAMYRFSGDVYATSSTAYASTWIVATAVRNGSTATIYINGTERGSNGSAGVNVDGEAITIGASRTAEPSEFFDGDVAEILIYNRALTTTEREQIRDYLGAKWGITVQ